jgi:hypothetical protein
MPVIRVLRRLLAVPLLAATLVVPAVMPIVPPASPPIAHHHHHGSRRDAGHTGHAGDADRCCDLCVVSCVAALGVSSAAPLVRHGAAGFAEPLAPRAVVPRAASRDVRLPPLLGPPALHA